MAKVLFMSFTIVDMNATQNLKENKAFEIKKQVKKLNLLINCMRNERYVFFKKLSGFTLCKHISYKRPQVYTINMTWCLSRIMHILV